MSSTLTGVCSLLTLCHDRKLQERLKGEVSGLRPDWRNKVRMILSRLDAARHPLEMDVAGLRFHALKGFDPRRYAVTVSRNWRITFAWSGEDAVDVDLEDYHGA